MEFPYIHIRIPYAVCYALGGIDHASSAYCQDKIYLFPPAQLNTLSCHGKNRIGLNAS